jgi:hypothetical protein
MRLRISALFLSVVLSTVAASAQSNQTLTGTVSDAMRGGHHMMQERLLHNAPANASSKGLTLPLSAAARCTR